MVPAAATISGDGVSPAARAAASGSPPGSAAATASADAGPPRGIGLDAAHDRAIDRRVEVADHLRGPRDAFLLAPRDQFREVASFDGAPPGEHLVEHQAERVDVAARRHFAAGELFRGHVGGRTGAQRLARRAGEAEVGDPDLAVAVEHDVRRLQIAMDDAPVVGGGETGADLARELDGAVLGEASDAADQRREILAVHVFHRQERVPLVLADVIDAADVGMRDLPRHSHFRVELRQARRIVVESAVRNFNATGWPSFKSSAR